jgi:Amt family ammonium transporter
VIGLTLTPWVLAQEVSSLEDPAVGINVLWVLLAGFFVFFMQAGFALVETGFTRSKNVTHTMMMNMMVFCLGAVGYWICGFAFQFGGVNHTWEAVTTVGAVATEGSTAWAHSPVTLGDWSGHLESSLAIGGQAGLSGLSGFFLSGIGTNFGILAFFLFQMVFMDTAATIPTGSTAERIKFVGFILMSLWVSMFIYPLIGNWVWGGGWLQNLGRSAGLGNGVVDFAGSGVVHMVGGAVGLAGAKVIGPRLGKFRDDGSANAIPGHNIPLGVLGTIILFFGWFGFNPGSSLGFMGGARELAVNAAVNTLLAGAVGGCTAMFFTWLRFGRPDPTLSVNGILAGLVAITAPCAFVDSVAAVLIALIAGILVCVATFWLEASGIDDPVGAVPVHFVNGSWGVLSVGLFAKGLNATAGWNGMEGTVRGLFSGNPSQLVVQGLEVLAVVTVAGGLSYIFFSIIHSMGLLRVSEEDELQGLDLPEMGMFGYMLNDPDL